jgi:PTS system nitrogen regulatory IIA component
LTAVNLTRMQIGDPMKISDFLLPARVILDVRANGKADLLRELSHQAAASVGLDADETALLIAKREELGSTGVGNGVGLPHARIAGLKTPFGLLARLRRAIDFDAVDDQPVDIVFLLLLPETANGEQLNALACVARALRDLETLRQIREAADNNGAFQAIAASSTSA